VRGNSVWAFLPKSYSRFWLEMAGHVCQGGAAPAHVVHTPVIPKRVAAGGDGAKAPQVVGRENTRAGEGRVTGVVYVIKSRRPSDRELAQAALLMPERAWSDRPDERSRNY
jgi:hypothetical protein